MKSIAQSQRHPVREFFFILLVLIIAFLTTALYAQPSGTWAEVTPLPSYAALGYSNADWGDYDNDGDLDLAIIGHRNGHHYFYLFRNDGGDVFTEITTGIEGVSNGDVEWGDIDNDGDLDIAVSGEVIQYSRFTGIYRNEGNDTFVETAHSDWLDVNGSMLSWVDFHRDGDLDLIVMGLNASRIISEVNLNDGQGNFIPQGTFYVAAEIAYGSVAWVDCDNDSGFDLYMSGWDGSQRKSFLFDLDQQVGTGGLFEPVRDGSAAWADYDLDQDLDLLITGESDTGEFTGLYRNDGNKAFTLVDVGFPAVRVSSVAWGDYDNDNDPDVLISGWDGATRITKLFNNQGDGTFVEDTFAFPGIAVGEVAWVDYDNDGDLDVFLIGITNGTPAPTEIIKLYRNDISTLQQHEPPVPTNLTYTLDPDDLDSITFSWDAPAPNLTYNIRVGTTSGGFDVLAPMSAVAETGEGKATTSQEGYRKVVRHGQTGMHTGWSINLPQGTYYWSVQAVNAAYQGSAFATEQIFTGGEGRPVPVKIWLQGAYTGAAMHTELHDSGKLPVAHPFQGSPWTFTVPEAVLEIPNDQIVDWVLVELRANTQPGSIVARRAGFIRTDGLIVELNGETPLQFSSIDYGELYYVVVRHVNHLDVMTAEPVMIRSNSQLVLYDFTEAADRAYGGDLMELKLNVFGMYGGDANADGQIAYIGADRDQLEIISLLGTGSLADVYDGYHPADMNLDGRVIYIGAERDQRILLEALTVDNLADIIQSNVPD